jgi:hypothetical protein
MNEYTTITVAYIAGDDEQGARARMIYSLTRVSRDLYMIPSTLDYELAICWLAGHGIHPCGRVLQHWREHDTLLLFAPEHTDALEALFS